MSISSALTSLNQDIQNARTAIVNKGGTVTSGGGSSQLATDIATIPSGSGGKYKLLDRVKDDSNNEIGTVSGFFTDANDVEYAVVCLDAIYRNSSVNYAANNTTVISLPYYTNQGVYEEINTATHNTTQILNKVTSTACSHCRNQSFVIGNTTYYGQLPNIIELIDIFKHRTIINSMDTSGGSIIIPSSTVTWSSTSYSVSSAWAINAAGRVLNTTSRKSDYLCIPVLEIPNGD